MGISLLTILTIENNGDNILCTASQCRKTKKWAGEINLMREGLIHSRLIDEPNPSHETKTSAIARMEEIVQAIRNKQYGPVQM